MMAESKKMWVGTGVGRRRVFDGGVVHTLLMPVVLRRLLGSVVNATSAVVIDGMKSTTVSTMSLISSVGVLMVRTFSTLTTKNTVIYTRCVKRKGGRQTGRSTQRMLFVVAFVSMIIDTFYLVFRGPLLHLVFKTIRTSIVETSRVCFFCATLSFPFVTTCSTTTSVFETRRGAESPVLVSVMSGIVGVIKGTVVV